MAVSNVRASEPLYKKFLTLGTLLGKRSESMFLYMVSMRLRIIFSCVVWPPNGWLFEKSSFNQAFAMPCSLMPIMPSSTKKYPAHLASCPNPFKQASKRWR